jgi:hypothetical protein
MNTLMCSQKLFRSFRPSGRGFGITIPLIDPGARPPSRPLYRLSQSEREEALRQTKLLLDKGVIQPSTSPYGAPILFVHQKDGSLRMVIDYRALCHTNKARTTLPVGLLQPVRLPEKPWHTVSMDFITQLPKTGRGHDAFFVVVDKVTKMVHLMPTNGKATAKETAKLYAGLCGDCMVSPTWWFLIEIPYSQSFWAGFVSADWDATGSLYRIPSADGWAD